MRILFVVPYVPNLIRVRSFNLIRELSDMGHEVTVLTLTSNPGDKEAAASLEKYCHSVVDSTLTRWRSMWNCLAALPTSKPLQSVYCWQPDLADRLAHLTNAHNGEMPFDIVHVEHLRGVQYGLFLNQLNGNNGSGVPVVWDSVDCITELFRKAASQGKTAFGRWITRFELGRTERYESWLQSQFSQMLVTSPVDKRLLTNLQSSNGRSGEITVLPNGVDLSYFRPDPLIKRDPATIVISGKMSYHANIAMAIHLVEDIMPLVWASRPETRVVIAGKDPSAEIRNTAEDPRINVTGTVDDIRPYIQKATIAVAPITYGAGIQNKVLEAMACATPVVADKQVTGSIEAQDGHHFLVADSPRAYADQIIGLLSNPSRRQNIGENGRMYVEQHHHWSAITEKLELVYRQAIEQHAKGSNTY